MSISLSVAPKQEIIPEKVAMVEMPPVIREREEMEIVAEEPQQANQGSSNSSIEFPAFIKKENMRKERVYVSKGSVITQYEDDMDVPTFLRKQMQ